MLVISAPIHHSPRPDLVTILLLCNDKHVFPWESCSIFTRQEASLARPTLNPIFSLKGIGCKVHHNPISISFHFSVTSCANELALC